MHIDLQFTAQNVDEKSLRDKTVVAIDVLRASTSITTALMNGAREVIPVVTVEAAVKLASNLAADVVLLAGERNARMIDGFHLGNSPLAYVAESVKGKIIVFSSTNGALALAKGRLAKELAVCSFVNISEVVSFVSQPARDFTIICAGTNGAFSLEDAVCAGMLIHGVRKLGVGDMTLSDSSLAAMTLYNSLGKDLLIILRMGEHGRFLEEIGYGEDVRYCAGIDTVPVLPVLDGNVLRLKRDVEKKEAATPQG